MEYNWVLFFIGIGISLIALLFIFKSKNNFIDEENLLIEKLREYSNSKAMPISDSFNKELFRKLEEISEELKYLKEEVEHIGQGNGVPIYEQDLNGESEQFSNLFHYNMFLEKNSKIIELHRAGKSPKEIAKALNRSVREIEMVVGLIK